MNLNLQKISEELDSIGREIRIALSPLQEEYRKYFMDKLDKHDLKGLASADEDKLMAFFDDIKDGWVKGEGQKS